MPIFAVGFLVFLNGGVFFIGNFLNSNLTPVAVAISDFDQRFACASLGHARVRKP